MSKDRLVFDTTDANTIIDSDSVGAFVRAADGTLITKTTVAAKDGLDVNVINASIAVTATDLDIRDLTQADEVTVFQGTDPWVIGDGGNSITVDAIDLDIRDLVAATDSVSAWTKDGSGNAITSTAGALDVNLKSPIVVDVSTSHLNDSMRLGDGTSFFTSTTVGADIGLDVNLINASIAVTATDLDIRDLVAATDSVSSYTKDGTGTAITSTVVGADTGLDVNVLNTISTSDAALANTAIANAANALGVANTAEAVVTSPLAARKYLYVYNAGNRQIHVGAAGVTAANGYPLSPGSEMMFRAGASIAMEWVGPVAGQEIRTLELA